MPSWLASPKLERNSLRIWSQVIVPFWNLGCIVTSYTEYKSFLSIYPEPSRSNFKKALSTIAYHLSFSTPQTPMRNSVKSTVPSPSLSKKTINLFDSSLVSSTPISLKPTANSSLSSFQSPLYESNCLKVRPSPAIVLVPLFFSCDHTLSRITSTSVDILYLIILFLKFNF